MKWKILAAIVFLLLSYGCVSQEDMLILDDRLLRLEQQHSGLEQRFAEMDERLVRLEKEVREQQASGRRNAERREQTLRGKIAGLRVEVEEIRNEVRGLLGRVEEAEYRLRKKDSGAEQKTEGRIARMEEALRGVRDRVAGIETYLNFDASDAGKAAGAPAPTDPKDLNEKDLYNYAKSAFDRGEYEAAREAFSNLLKRYPKSGDADNAQFWIGETYYREKWFKKAILEYQRVIEDYPKGNKVPAARLKQGLSFLQIGDKANARLILKELVKKHPDSSEARVADEKLKQLK